MPRGRTPRAARKIASTQSRRRRGWPGHVEQVDHDAGGVEPHGLADRVADHHGPGLLRRLRAVDVRSVACAARAPACRARAGAAAGPPGRRRAGSRRAAAPTSVSIAASMSSIPARMRARPGSHGRRRRRSSVPSAHGTGGSSVLLHGSSLTGWADECARWYADGHADRRPEPDHRPDLAPSRSCGRARCCASSGCRDPRWQGPQRRPRRPRARADALLVGFVPGATGGRGAAMIEREGIALRRRRRRRRAALDRDRDRARRAHDRAQRARARRSRRPTGRRFERRSRRALARARRARLLGQRAAREPPRRVRAADGLAAVRTAALRGRRGGPALERRSRPGRPRRAEPRRGRGAARGRAGAQPVEAARTRGRARWPPPRPRARGARPRSSPPTPPARRWRSRDRRDPRRTGAPAPRDRERPQPDRRGRRAGGALAAALERGEPLLEAARRRRRRGCGERRGPRRATAPGTLAGAARPRLTRRGQSLRCAAPDIVVRAGVSMHASAARPTMRDVAAVPA